MIEQKAAENDGPEFFFFGGKTSTSKATLPNQQTYFFMFMFFYLFYFLDAFVKGNKIFCRIKLDYIEA